MHIMNCVLCGFCAFACYTGSFSEPVFLFVLGIQGEKSEKKIQYKAE